MLRHPWKKTAPRSSEEPPRSRFPSGRHVAAAYLCAFLYVLLVSACVGFAAPPEGKSPPPMVIGMSARVLSAVDLKDAQATMRLWLDRSRVPEEHYFVRDVRIIADETEMRNAVEKKEINYVIALAIDYIRLRDLGLVGKDNAAGVAGNTTDEYVLLVRRNGGVKDLKGLGQKKIIIQTGGLGEVPTLWLDTLLMKNGLSASREYCREVKDAPKATGAVLPVFFGQADACVAVKKAFMTMVELNPQIGQQVGMLAQSASFPRAVSWFGRDWDEKSIEKYRARMLEANGEANGKQFLTLMGYDDVVVWNRANLGSLEALLKEYDELSKKAKEKEDAARGDGAKPERADAPPATVPETSGRADPQPAKGK